MNLNIINPSRSAHDDSDDVDYLVDDYVVSHEKLLPSKMMSTMGPDSDHSCAFIVVLNASKRQLQSSRSKCTSGDWHHLNWNIYCHAVLTQLQVQLFAHNFFAILHVYFITISCLTSFQTSLRIVLHKRWTQSGWTGGRNMLPLDIVAEAGLSCDGFDVIA